MCSMIFLCHGQILPMPWKMCFLCHGRCVFLCLGNILVFVLCFLCFFYALCASDGMDDVFTCHGKLFYLFSMPWIFLCHRKCVCSVHSTNSVLIFFYVMENICLCHGQMCLLGARLGRCQRVRSCHEGSHLSAMRESSCH